MWRRRKQPEHIPPAFHLETLETRILFSADAAFTVLDGVPEPVAELVMLQQSESAELAAEGSVQAGEVQTKALVILDFSLPDLEQLLADLQRSGQEQRHVVVLDAHTDALTQISDILAEQRGLTAVHVMSHGSSGVLELGGQRIGTLDLLSRAEEVVNWRSALAPGADLLLYGCELAADGAGRQFVDTLARLTSADVSASTDLTGSADKGGDWQLEYHQGDVQSDVALSAELQDSYRETLRTHQANPLNNTGGSSLREPLNLSGIGDRKNIDKGDSTEPGEGYLDQPESGPARFPETGTLNSSFTAHGAVRPPLAVDSSRLGVNGTSRVSVEATPVELVFVQAGLTDSDTFIADLQQNALDANRSLSVVVLNNVDNGFDQINTALARYTDLDAIHFVTHGADGKIQLGGSWLSASNVDQHIGDLQSWGTVLSDTGDILMYGCDVAASDDGRWLVQQMGTLTGADVAASDDTTGHADLGGDWILEYRDGEVATDIAFDDVAQAAWQGTLDIASDLILHNTFDTDASDSSGNGYNGTLTNGAVINTTGGTNQIGGGKASLDGNNDYVDLSAHVSNFDNLAQGTIAVWVYTDSVSGSNVIFEASDSGDGNSHLAIIRQGDGIVFYVNEGSTTQLDVTTTVANLIAGTWNHVVVTVDTSGNKLYVNGVQQSVSYRTGSAGTNRFFDDVSQLDFMAWGVDKYNGTTFGDYFDGFLDDGRIYDRALSGTDVTELYNYTNNAPTATNLNAAESYTEDTPFRVPDRGSVNPTPLGGGQYCAGA